ncbi:MAG TPA: fumarylacetoacetate hydrolase family protein, partial [Nitrospiria bacterium]
MKFVRFEHEQKTTYGLLEGDRLRVIEGDPFSGYRATDQTLPLNAARLLAPCLPSKIIAVGINYAEHAAEFRKEPPKEPLLFMKPPTALLDPEGVIRIPSQSRRVDFEAELAAVIGRRAKDVPEERAGEFILGYTCFNDVTARDLQKTDGQWTRAKGFDSFAPLGPWIDTDLDPRNLRIESYLNGERRQSASTSEMIFKVPALIGFISRVMTLLPGDVIATGTP